MAMVGVALVLYGFIKFVSWTFSGSGNNNTLLSFSLYVQNIYKKRMWSVTLTLTNVLFLIYLQAVGQKRLNLKIR